MTRRFAILGIPVFFSILSATLSPIAAGTISVRWDAVSHPELAGYKLYHGPSAGVYDQSLAVGNTTSATLTGLADCATRYLAIKALAHDGSESAVYSSEVAGWPRPTIESVTPSRVERGSQIDLTITGSNFRPGSSVQFSDPALTVLGVVDQGCGQRTVQLAVGATAALGAIDVTVVHADNVYGTGSGLLDIDPGPPVISAVSTVTIGDTDATIRWTTDSASDSQVRFRRVGDSSWQSTPVDVTPVTQHSVQLTGLQPQTVYEYTVHSEDSGGRTASAAGPAPFTTLAGPHRYLRIEAEALDESPPLSSVSRSDAFAGAFVELAPTAGAGSVGVPSGQWNLTFHLPHTGSWVLWARLSGDDPSADGWQERVDGGSWAALLPGSGGPWHWTAARTRTLTAGMHTWSLGGLDPGARLDRILLTDDPEFQPTESPGGDVSPPSPAFSPLATAGDAQVQLSWSNPSDPGAIRVVIRYRTDGIAPRHPADGLPWLDRAAVAGADDGETHAGLINGVTYTYGIFVVDGAGNASAPAVTEGRPEIPVSGPPTVGNLRRIDVLGG